MKGLDIINEVKVREFVNSKMQELLLLPHRKRLQVANNIYSFLHRKGMPCCTAKRVMRSMGISRGLIFRLSIPEQMQSKPDIPEQMLLTHSCSAGR